MRRKLDVTTVVALACLMLAALTLSVDSAAAQGEQEPGEPFVEIVDPPSGSEVSYPVTVRGRFGGFDPAFLSEGRQTPITIDGNEFSYTLEWDLPTVRDPQIGTFVIGPGGAADLASYTVVGLPLDQDPPEIELDIPDGPLTTPFVVEGRVVDATGVDPEDMIIQVSAGEGRVFHFWEGDPPFDGDDPTFSFGDGGTFSFVVDLRGVGGASGNEIEIEVRAEDLHGHHTRQMWNVEVAEAFDVVPPLVDITFPKRYRLSDHVVRIAGTADDDLPILDGFALVAYSGFAGTLQLPLEIEGDRWEVVFDPRLWRGWVWTQDDEFTAEIWLWDSQQNAGFETVSFKVPRVDAYCFEYGVTVDLGKGERPTDGDDVILGTPGDDIINAGRGNDVVCAGDGNDRVYGNSGSDLILGEGGRDRIWSGPGNDAVSGGPGRDRIRAGRGSDLVFGEGGRDTIWGGPGDDELFGGGGNDRLDGGSGDAVLRGGAGIDTCRPASLLLGCER